MPPRFLCPWDFSGKNYGWVAISFSRGSSWPGIESRISYIGRQILYCWQLGKPQIYLEPLSPLFHSCSWSWNCTSIGNIENLTSIPFSMTHSSLPRRGMACVVGKTGKKIWVLAAYTSCFSIWGGGLEDGLVGEIGQFPTFWACDWGWLCHLNRPTDSPLELVPISRLQCARADWASIF